MNNLKLLMLMILFVSLYSCGGTNADTVSLIHQYNDSIGVTKERLSELQRPIDSIREAYIDEYPAKAFSLDHDQKVQGAKYKKAESAAYHDMIIKSGEYAHVIFKRQIYLETKIMLFQSKIDSLKLELEK